MIRCGCTKSPPSNGPAKCRFEPEPWSQQRQCGSVSSVNRLITCSPGPDDMSRQYQSSICEKKGTTMTAMPFRINNDGSSSHVFSDQLIPLRDKFGSGSIRRASHVEPSGCGWTADMEPMGGPVLGPFAKREEALQEEIQWLAENL